jgi:hypothetical protein
MKENRHAKFKDCEGSQIARNNNKIIMVRAMIANLL